jgi:hypothetical protein
MITEKDIVKGFRYADNHGEIRVMAVADGWVLARRPRMVPFAIQAKWIAAYIRTGDLQKVEAKKD